MMNELKQRGHARDKFDPQEFIEAFENAETEEERGEIREALHRIDGGRFHDFLDEAHRLLSHSDLKRREEFRENYSDHLVQWVRAFGTVEELNTFPDL